MSFGNNSVEQIFNRNTGKDENAKSILTDISDTDDYVRLRRHLYKKNIENDPLYQCSECGTSLELSCMPDGNGDHTYYFKHKRDPLFVECSIKTNSKSSIDQILRRQYAFKSESNAHLQLKERVGEIIKRFIYPEVIIDKKFIHDKFGDNEKRKPDIFFKLGNREITIEFQINNTFHSVINDRESFYERNLISLIWVFGEFDPESFQSISIKDIYIPNGNNAFVFDQEAEQASYNLKTLCFHVYYKKYSLRGDSIAFDWQQEIIAVNQLKFNSITLRPFYFDCDAELSAIERELEIILKERQIEISKSPIQAKAKQLKAFLSDFKKNDATFDAFKLMEVNMLSEDETEIYNDELSLNTILKNGNNIIQALAKEEKYHGNLITFLLKAQKLRISELSINDRNETTLISILDAFKYPHDQVQQLFMRGYKLNIHDLVYVESKYPTIERKELLYLFRGYEKLSRQSLANLFYISLKEFLVIESAKNGHLTILGNEKQTLVWMANLAADSYSKYWYYYDRAFSFYDLYEKIFKMDKNGTFRKKYQILSSKDLAKHHGFEKILSKLYPELLL